MKRGHAVYDAVGSHFGRVVHEHSHPRFHAHLYEERFLSQVHPRHLTQRPVHRRNHRTDDHSGDVIAVQSGEREQIPRQHAVFVHRLLARRGQPPIRNQLCPAKHAQHGVRVSHVNGQQHLPRLRHVAGNDRYDAPILALDLQQAFRP